MTAWETTHAPTGPSTETRAYVEQVVDVELARVVADMRRYDPWCGICGLEHPALDDCPPHKAKELTGFSSLIGLDDPLIRAGSAMAEAAADRAYRIRALADAHKRTRDESTVKP